MRPLARFSLSLISRQGRNPISHECEPTSKNRESKVLTRNLEAARDAYATRDLNGTIRAHNAKATEAHMQEQGKYLKSVVYGGLDGIITTFAVVAGVAGASLSSGIVLILGFANLIADGLSMAIGDYLSTKAENEYNRAEREREAWEVRNHPEGERRELEEIYVDKGFGQEDARQLVEIISKDEEAWVSTMMVEELGIMESDESPYKNAIATFLSFSVFGVVPLMAFVVSLLNPAIQENGFLVASVMTGVVLFILGALKVRITQRSWIKSGLEMLVVGGLAAIAAYTVGLLLAGLA